LHRCNPQPRSAPLGFDDCHTPPPTAPFLLQQQYFNRQELRIMPLTTSSEGAIFYSVLLTNFLVTGHYEVHPGILRNKIRTQQSTWMEMALEDGSGAAVALEDGDGVAAFGGGVGRRLKIAAVLGSGRGRRACDDGIGISVVEAKGLLLQRWYQCWRGRQERKRLMQGTYVGSNGKEIGIFWQWWRWRRHRYDDSIDKARARGQWCWTSTGKARAMQQWHCN
jgi:hypothetical protein